MELAESSGSGIGILARLRRVKEQGYYMSNVGGRDSACVDNVGDRVREWARIVVVAILIVKRS